MDKLSRLLDYLAEFLAARRGLLPLLGVILIVMNAILQFIPDPGWLVETNLLLHFGVVVAIIGLLLAKVL